MRLRDSSKALIGSGQVESSHGGPPGDPNLT